MTSHTCPPGRRHHYGLSALTFIGASPLVSSGTGGSSGIEPDLRLADATGAGRGLAAPSQIVWSARDVSARSIYEAPPAQAESDVPSAKSKATLDTVRTIKDVWRAEAKRERRLHGVMINPYQTARPAPSLPGQISLMSDRIEQILNNAFAYLHRMNPRLIERTHWADTLIYMANRNICDALRFPQNLPIGMKGSRHVPC